MTNYDPKVLAARIEVLEEAVRTLQESNAELRDRIDALLNPPAGQFPSKRTDYLWILCMNLNRANKLI